MATKSDETAAQIFNYSVILIAFLAGVIVTCIQDDASKADPIRLPELTGDEIHLIHTREMKSDPIAEACGEGA